jgi:hypothetical protein
MSISELGSLGEFVSSIGVLITLVYLAVQVRHSKHIAMGHSYQTRVGFRIDAHRHESEPHIAELSTKVGAMENTADFIKNFNKLEEIQKQQYRHITLIQVQQCDNTFYQYSLGLIGEEQMLQAAVRVQMAYGVWEYMTAYIPPHVQRSYEKYKESDLVP